MIQVAETRAPTLGIVAACEAVGLSAGELLSRATARRTCRAQLGPRASTVSA